MYRSLPGGDAGVFSRLDWKLPIVKERDGYSVIVFQGSHEHGWKGSLGTKYFLARDRKGVITSPAVMLAYFVLANLSIFEFYRAFFDPQNQFNYSLLSTDWAKWLFLVNFGFLIWRLTNRMVFTGMIYNVRHALMAAPRLVVGNFVNFFATWRAVRVYLGHRISGTALVWDKTSHSYPVQMGDLTLPNSQTAIEHSGARKVSQPG